jgi:hypothetical protein
MITFIQSIVLPEPQSSVIQTPAVSLREPEPNRWVQVNPSEDYRLADVAIMRKPTGTYLLTNEVASQLRWGEGCKRYGLLVFREKQEHFGIGLWAIESPYWDLMLTKVFTTRWAKINPHNGSVAEEQSRPDVEHVDKDWLTRTIFPGHKADICPPLPEAS